MLQQHFQTILQTYLINYIPFDDINTRMNIGIALTTIIIAFIYYLKNRFNSYIDKLNIFSYKNTLLIPKDSIAYDSFIKYIELKHKEDIKIARLNTENGQDNNIIEQVKESGLIEDGMNISIGEKEIIIIKSNKSVEDILFFKDKVIKYIKDNTINKIKIGTPIFNKNNRGKKTSVEKITYKYKKIIKRLSNTFLSEDVNRELLNDISIFMNSKEKYMNKGISYKRGYILHGPPGTGKTSIIQAIASEYNCFIYNIDLSVMDSNEILVETFNNISSLTENMEQPHIILIEDLDRCYYDLRISMNCLLNVIDGVNDSENRILFITCNEINRITEIDAFTRPGRIDKKIELKCVDSKQASSIISNYFSVDGIDINIDYEITPATIINVCQRLNDLKETIKFIENKEDIKNIDVYIEDLNNDSENENDSENDEVIEKEEKCKMSKLKYLMIMNDIDILFVELEFWKKQAKEYSGMYNIKVNDSLDYGIIDLYKTKENLCIINYSKTRDKIINFLNTRFKEYKDIIKSYKNNDLILNDMDDDMKYMDIDIENPEKLHFDLFEDKDYPNWYFEDTRLPARIYNNIERSIENYRKDIKLRDLDNLIRVVQPLDYNNEYSD